MPDLDLNLLVALDALLRERSVTAAARRLGLSTSAMSRTLSRLRVALDDPLLVAAGRGMVATPHAEAIADQVRSLTSSVRTVLAPPSKLDVSALQRDFTIRANEAFVLLHAARLSAAVTRAAPGVRLRFAPKPDKEIFPLREAEVDLEIGVVSGYSAELRCQALFTDSFVGVARAGHAIFDKDRITATDYAACGHVVASWGGRLKDPVDDGLAALGLSRRINVIVPSFPAVIAVAAASDLLGIVTRSCCQPELMRQAVTFELPLATPEIVISQLWHPRMDADLGHRWLRALVFEVFTRLS